jgi:hypothetical protein
MKPVYDKWVKEIGPAGQAAGKTRPAISIAKKRQR